MQKLISENIMSTVQPAAPHPSCFTAHLSVFMTVTGWQGNKKHQRKGEVLTREGRTFFPGVTTALFMEKGHQAGVKGYLFSEYTAYSNKDHTKFLRSALPWCKESWPTSCTAGPKSQNTESSHHILASYVKFQHFQHGGFVSGHLANMERCKLFINTAFHMKQMLFGVHYKYLGQRMRAGKHLRHEALLKSHGQCCSYLEDVLLLQEA